ncbi:MAG: Kelch repeat-containing protein [Candidatus Kariarchaeaceae archaeon]|jgi:hypothetical protein
MALYQSKINSLLHTLLVIILFLVTPILAADNASDHPGPLMGHAMVYDTANNKAIMYGGTDSDFQANSDTWSYDFATNQWTKHNLVSKPHATMFHEMVYDPDLEQTIFTQGENYLWRFDYTTDTWSSINHNYGPAGRSSYSLYYDTVNKKIILYGGMVETTSGSVISNDTWEFDALENRWTEMNPETSMEIRYGHTMIYDTSSGTGLLMGGNRLDMEIGQSNEVWSYDYSENNWAKLTTTNDPPIRYWHSSAYSGRR